MAVTGASTFRIDFAITSGDEDVQSIAAGCAVDDLNYLMQVDPTGKTRSFSFDFSAVKKTISAYSTINVVIRMMDFYGNVSDWTFSKNQAVEAGLPQVSNARISQRRDGSGLVGVSYDYQSPHEIDPATVSVSLSIDGGRTWNVPTTSMAGDAGAGIAVGSDRRVTWSPYIDLTVSSPVSVRASVSLVNSDGNAAVGGFETGPILVTPMTSSAPAVSVVPQQEKARYAKPNGNLYKNAGFEFQEFDSSSVSSQSSQSSQSSNSSSSKNSSSSSTGSSHSSRSSKSSSGSSLSSSSNSSASSPSSPSSSSSSSPSSSSSSSPSSSPSSSSSSSPSSSSSSSVLVSSLFTYVLDSPIAGQVTITKYLGSAAALAIPNLIKGRTVVALANPTAYTSIITSPSTLTSVTIPNTVTNIGSYAFYNCPHLTSVTMPNGLVTIGDNAFSYCTALPSITIPSAVTTIGNYSFEYCTALTGTVTIPDSVTSLGSSAFGDCSILHGVLIGNGVTNIGSRAFGNCSTLASVSFGSSVSTIGDSAFAGTSALTGVSLPSGLITIGDAAFLNSGLTSITIPNSVTTLGSISFVCPNLVSAVIGSGVTTWGYTHGGVFEPNNTYGTGNLQSVTFVPGLTNIGVRAFQWCSGLGPSLSFPSSITSIGDSAFNMNNYYYDNPSAPPPSLNAAYFQGNSPTLGSLAFCNEAAGFTAYYRSGATGFDLPWGDGGYPTATWIGPPY